MTAAQTRFIATDGVSKTYNAGRSDEVRAVDSVTMQVDRGEVLVLRGPERLRQDLAAQPDRLHVEADLGPRRDRRPRGGQARRGGAHPGAERRRFGFIFQQYYLIPDLPRD